MELGAFVLLVVLIKMNTEIKIRDITFAYIEKLGLGGLLVRMSCAITIGAFTFFVQHFGPDPTLKFDE
jgi:hypothetical protein